MARTALVTGASSGIGFELCRVLARNGYDLVMAARREGPLHESCERVRAEFGGQHRAVAADLSSPAGVTAAADVAAREGSLDVLVNNAGFTVFGRFVETDLDEQLGLLGTNVVAVTHLTRLLAPGMATRGSGRIMNVASTAAFLPGPLMATYYASKAYVLSFSQALSEELRGTGVTVTALCPGPTRTGFQERGNVEDTKLVQGRKLDSALEVAEAGYRGMMAGKRVVVPGLRNRLEAALGRLAPAAMTARAVHNAHQRTRPE